MTATFPTESTSFFNGVTCEWTHQFVWHASPITMNAAHNGKANRWTINDMIAEWRKAFRLMSEGCERLAWCHIVVDHYTGTRREVDPVACAPSYKAALDGLRAWTDKETGVSHPGVLEDDGPRYVRSVLFNAPVFAGYDALVLTLKGPAA